MTEPEFFHGGAPGLPVGGKLLPSSETGAPSLANYDRREFCRRDRVYLTRDIEVAKIYAAMHPSGRGVIYACQPVGDIEPDPDCLVSGLSYMAASAQIVRRFKLRGKEIRRIQNWMLGGVLV